VARPGRRLEQITLTGGPLGDIGIIVSLPDPLPAGKLPILVVLGGLGTGENNIRAIETPGDNAIVGYDWPMPVDFPKGRELVRQLPKLYRLVMDVPGQVASAIDWLAAQPWADDKRISILGFSLGALAAPAVENLAQHDGHHIGWTIIAYGGAPLGALFASNPHMKPKWVGPLIDLLLHPLQPTVNLPYLSSHFLVLEGRDDALIAAPAREALRDAVPDPKDVVVFGGDHMGVGPDKQALLEQIIRTSRGWLIRNNAVNAPPP
jgi:dienelactone hydrolase